MRNKLVIDLKQSKWIPALSMCTLCVYMAVSFNELGLSTASYAAMAAMLLTWAGAMLLQSRLLTISKYSVWGISLLLWVLLITLANDQDWKYWLFDSLSILAFLSLLHHYQDQYSTLAKAASLTMSICIFAQLAQCILNPEMWVIVEYKSPSGYLLGGNYNQIGSRCILALAMGNICWSYGRWYKINMICTALACLAILLMVQSMTSLTCIILFVLASLLRNRRLLKIGIAIGIAVIILFEVLVCFQGNGLAHNEYAKWFVEDVLHKDLTFTGRTGLWENAMNLFYNNPIFGYGYPTKNWYFRNISTIAIGAHNQIISTMLYGGLIGLSIYIGTIYTSLRNAMKRNNTRSIKACIAFVLLCIMMMFETYSMPIIFLLLTFLYYFPETRSDLDEQ